MVTPIKSATNIQCSALDRVYIRIIGLGSILSYHSRKPFLSKTNHTKAESPLFEQNAKILRSNNNCSQRRVCRSTLFQFPAEFAYAKNTLESSMLQILNYLQNYPLCITVLLDDHLINLLLQARKRDVNNSCANCHTKTHYVQSSLICDNEIPVFKLRPQFRILILFGLCQLLFEFM